MNKDKIIYGIYSDDDVILEAVKTNREKGHHIDEVYTPFPIHGLDVALGLKYSRIAITSFIYGCIGASCALLMFWYMMIYDWPMIIGGKPWGSTTSNMNLAEILMFKKALSQAERIQVIRHLSKKWGLELTVDSDNDGIVDVHDIDPIDPKKWMMMPSVFRKNSSDSYTPLDELELWYDSTNTDGNNNLGLGNNSKLSIWSDLSGNAQKLLQPSSDKQPTLYTHNSKQYIKFDGSNDSLGKDINGHVLDNPTGKNVTIFTVSSLKA